ncbi:MAG: hypothetical protein KDK05_10465 [Candidatus Competibacteraceae bacterium]|nr:hypothetical protein [Anaerolineales bacterium]MCB1715545.1 hypothetical protein [Candidatus Competibacteraceae bacterium]
MANPDYVAELVEALCGMYRRESSPIMLAMYAKAWADIDDEELGELIQAHQETDESFPLPATIRKLRTEVHMKREGIPDVMEAWGQVRSRSGNTHPLAQQAFDHIGGWSAFGRSLESDEPTWRANFRIAYEAVIANERQRRTMSKASQQATGLLQAGDDSDMGGKMRQLVDSMRLS